MSVLLKTVEDNFRQNPHYGFMNSLIRVLLFVPCAIDNLAMPVI